MKTKDAFVDKDDFDPDEALTAAIKKKEISFGTSVRKQTVLS